MGVGEYDLLLAECGRMWVGVGECTVYNCPYRINQLPGFFMMGTLAFNESRYLFFAVYLDK